MGYCVVAVSKMVNDGEDDTLVDRLEASVNQKIAEGWKPQGGVQVLHLELTMTMAMQAMVKE